MARPPYRYERLLRDLVLTFDPNEWPLERRWLDALNNRQEYSIRLGAREDWASPRKRGRAPVAGATEPPFDKLEARLGPFGRRSLTRRSHAGQRKKILRLIRDRRQRCLTQICCNGRRDLNRGDWRRRNRRC